MLELSNHLEIVTALATVVLNALVLYVWKPWLKGYGGEKGKLLARKEDIDSIIEEMKRISTVTEDIKSRMAGDLWDRQKRWEQKRTIYGDLLTSSDALRRALTSYFASLKVQPQAEAAGAKAQNLQSQSAALNQITEHDSSFAMARAMAEVFCSGDCCAILKDHAEKDLAIGEIGSLVWAQKRALLHALLSPDLVKVAKTDLGVK